MSDLTHYKTGFAFNSRELFDTFNCTGINIRRDLVQKKYGEHSKQDFCAKVLLYCFYLILLDIIENNVTFVFPLFNGKTCNLSIKPIKGDELKFACSVGRFQDVDLFETDFTGYQLCLYYQTSKEYREKPIYIDHKMKKRLYELASQGKKYY